MNMKKLILNYAEGVDAGHISILYKNMYRDQPPLQQLGYKDIEQFLLEKCIQFVRLEYRQTVGNHTSDLFVFPKGKVLNYHTYMFIYFLSAFYKIDEYSSSLIQINYA